VPTSAENALSPANGAAPDGRDDTRSHDARPNDARPQHDAGPCVEGDPVTLIHPAPDAVHLERARNEVAPAPGDAAVEEVVVERATAIGGGVVLDTEANVATWWRAAYDVASVQAAIRAAGLPPRLADRLAIGA